MQPGLSLIQRLCANKYHFSSVPPFFTFMDQIPSHIGLVQTERYLLMPNIPEFRDNFIGTLNETELFEGADLAVMFTHFVLVVMVTNLSWLCT